MTRCYGFDGSGDAIIEDEAKVIRDCASRLLGKDRESLGRWWPTCGNGASPP